MPVPSLTRFVLLIGLSFFFGLAFEEFYASADRKPPGGIRTFPLLAIAGGALYLLDPKYLAPMTVGILVVGAWLAIFYRQELTETENAPEGRTALLVPAANLLAYLLGPLALAAPYWLTIGVAVAVVLLLTGREWLHALARRVDNQEIITAGQFLLLTGLVLPLLPDEPVSDLTNVTPYKAWLALLAVSGISYASYLIHRHLAPKQSDLWVALLGGLYSSTATTIALARRARAEPIALPRVRAGIVLATALMYLRVLVVIAMFNLGLAEALAPRLVILFLIGAAIAFALYRSAPTPIPGPAHAIAVNPLQLGAAAAFAALFVLVSVLATWVQQHYGQTGIDVFAAIVGVTDIDPFVLSIAQGSAAALAPSGAATAILIATASNNVLKAIYAAVLAGPGPSALASLALIGLGTVAVLAGLLF